MQCQRIRDEELVAQKMELLYGEADSEARAQIEAHLAECDACRKEMAAYRRLRQDLRAWTLKKRGAAPLAPIRPWLRRLPIAAALLLGLGTGIALRGYFSVKHDLAQQEARALDRDRRHSEEIAALRAALDLRTGAPDTDRLMARVDDAVKEGIQRSERRQREQLRAAFVGWTGEMEARRRLDLARVAAGLSYLEGQQGEQLARTNELMGYVVETAAQEE